MKDLMGMMSKVKEMQSKMEDMQAELENIEVEGTSGAGLVTVTLSGKGTMKGIAIDASLIVADEAEMLEDLIIAAHNDAKAKAETAMADKTRELTAGLPIPPGMKLPF